MKIFDRIKNIGKPKNQVIDIEKDLSSKKSVGTPKGFEGDPVIPFVLYSMNPDDLPVVSTYNFDNFRKDYLTVPAVSTCINGICREISNMKWGIKKKERSAASKKLVDRATEFFRRPNRNKRPFSHLTYCITKDALMYSAASIENVKNKKGELVEIYPRDGSTIIPFYDNHGCLKGYKQVVGLDVARFTPDELVYIEYNPDDYSPGGDPILYGLKNVCIAIRNAIQFLSRSLDYNSFPPGILSALGMTQKQMDGFVESLIGKRDGAKIDFELAGLGGVSDLTWTELKRDAKDIKQVEIWNALNKEVYRAFGVTSIEFGDTQDVNRATAIVQQAVGQSKLIRPLVDLMIDEINEGIIWTHMSDMIEIFAEPNIQRTRELIISENNLLIPNGQRTINEGRKLLNEEPLEGGDNAIFVVGGTFIKVADLDKDVSEILAYNVSQPDNNPSQEPKEEPKTEPKKEDKSTVKDKIPSVNYKKIEEIFKNKQENSIKTIIYNYFSPKGHLQNCIDEIASSYYGLLLHNVKIQMDSKIFKTKIVESIKKYETSCNKKAKYNSKELETEKSKLYKELVICFVEYMKGFEYE